MSQLKKHLQFSKQEQKAILVLLIILLLLMGVNLVPWPFDGPKQPAFHHLDSIMQLHQKAQKEQEQMRMQKFDVTNPDASVLAEKFNPFPFNPNMLPEEDWKRMGLSDHQIRNIKNYEKKGGKFFRKQDLKKIYTISEAEYQLLEPFIEIPEPSRARIARTSESKTPPNHSVSVSVEAKQINAIIELNQADSAQLLSLPGIGPWFAHRILQYRKLLGGFVDKGQLLQVYGMDSARAEGIYGHIQIDSSLIRKIKINQDDFRTLVKHPYMSFELTKAIVNYRERKGQIKNFEKVQELKNEHIESFDQLKYYLNYE